MASNRRTAVLVMALAALLPAAMRMQAPPPAMPALHGEAIAADAARGRLVLFGGRTSRGWLSGTWEWDGRAWRRAVDSAASPPARGGHALAYDVAGRRVFLFGLTSSPDRVSLRELDLTPPTDAPLLRHHVLHVLLPSLGDGWDTSACAEHSVTVA